MSIYRTSSKSDKAAPGVLLSESEPDSGSGHCCLQPFFSLCILHFTSPIRLQVLEIGFVFFDSASRFIAIISFQKGVCVYFALSKIGFVFSQPPTTKISVSHCLCRLKDILASAKLALFFQIKLHFSSFSTLFHLFFSLFCLFSFGNWVCFFK